MKRNTKREPSHKAHSGGDREVHDYYIDAFNAAFGSGITRPNIDIGYPRVQNYLTPKDLYADGSADPPFIVKDLVFRQGHQNIEPPVNALEGPADFDFYATILTNPDYTPGEYYPRYTKHQFYYDLPEDPAGYQDPVLYRGRPQNIAGYPLEIRRGMV